MGKRLRAIFGRDKASSLFNFKALVAFKGNVNIIECFLLFGIKSIAFKAQEGFGQRMEPIVGANLKRLVFGHKRFKAAFAQRGKRFFGVREALGGIDYIGVAIRKVVECNGIIRQSVASGGVHVDIYAIFVFRRSFLIQHMAFLGSLFGC